MACQCLGGGTITADFGVSAPITDLGTGAPAPIMGFGGGSIPGCMGEEA